MVHDAPLYVYVGYLMHQLHWVPYRDFFDVNPPGIFLFNQAYVSIFGYGDLGFRCVDLICLGAIQVTTWFWLKRLGRKVAWGAIVLFGLAYLGYGPVMSLQRDYVTIVPISTAILLASSIPRLNDVVRCVGIGMLFGVASTIKPHAAIGLPAVLCLGLIHGEARGASRQSWVTRIQMIVACLAGLAIPILAVIAYLWCNGALANFWEIVTESWPRYALLTGHLAMSQPGPAHLKYLVGGFLTLGGQAPWLLAGVAGSFLALNHPSLPKTSKVLVVAMAALTLSYGIYPVFGGKFWPYHWIIFTYMAIALASLCLAPREAQLDRGAALLPLLILALVVSVKVSPPREFLAQIHGAPIPPPKGGRVDEIASFLRSRLRPADVVQPLDWTGGAVQAMLIARARLATRYLYDEEFYHHVSTPYVQRLRSDFVRDLGASRARFIIEVHTEKPWVSGFDTTREFPELQRLLATEYTVVHEGKGYRILERSSA